LIHTLRALVGLYHEHIRKEDQVLLPLTDHCCPKQDRVVRMPAEGKGLESRKSGFSG
jgi:hemerythrin-like domain-containing protein